MLTVDFLASDDEAHCTISGSADKKLRAWDLSTFGRLLTLTGHDRATTSTVSCFSSSDGKFCTKLASDTHLGVSSSCRSRSSSCRRPLPCKSPLQSHIAKPAKRPQQLFAGHQPRANREVPLLERLLTRQLDVNDAIATERDEAVIAVTRSSHKPREHYVSILTHQLTAKEEHGLCDEFACSVHT